MEEKNNENNFPQDEPSKRRPEQRGINQKRGESESLKIFKKSFQKLQMSNNKLNPYSITKKNARIPSLVDTLWGDEEEDEEDEESEEDDFAFVDLNELVSRCKEKEANASKDINRKKPQTQENNIKITFSDVPVKLKASQTSI